MVKKKEFITQPIETQAILHMQKNDLMYFHSKSHALSFIHFPQNLSSEVCLKVLELLTDIR